MVIGSGTLLFVKGNSEKVRAERWPVIQKYQVLLVITVDIFDRLTTPQIVLFVEIIIACVHGIPVSAGGSLHLNGSGRK